MKKLTDISDRATEEIKKALFFRQPWTQPLADALESAYNAGLTRGLTLREVNRNANTTRD